MMVQESRTIKLLVQNIGTIKVMVHVIGTTVQDYCTINLMVQDTTPSLQWCRNGARIVNHHSFHLQFRIFLPHLATYGAASPREQRAPTTAGRGRR
jgi:hypothetical protein